ncbi:Ctr copper transporter family protein [Xylaria sp. CBS 124048]|nr:Ctr copper transporter family protein [Xylaria sp. CBS 124048]
MDHSRMDHSDMDHGNGGGGGGGGHGGMPMCKMNMLFTWDTTNMCIVFRQWQVTGPTSLVFSLLAIVAICAGYEGLREATRKYEMWLSNQEISYKRIGAASSQNQNSLHAGTKPVIGRPARIVKAVLYGVQNFYAFMIMLLFMTYNGYVMIAVALGTGLGYYFFGSHTQATKETACH